MHLKAAMERFDYIMLDFDGVVADTESVFDFFDCGILNEFLENAGLEGDLSPETMRAFAGVPAENKLEILLEERGVDPSSYSGEFSARRNFLRPDLFRQHPVRKGKNLEKFMEDNAGRCVLVTNKNRQRLGWDLEAMELENLFPKIVCLEPPMRRKPAPDILLKAMEIIGATPGKTTYVGDTVLDMKAAIAAGVAPIGFVIEGLDKRPEQVKSLTRAGALRVIDDFLEI